MPVGMMYTRKEKIKVKKKLNVARTLNTSCPVSMKFSAEDLHAMPLGIREFHKDRCRGRHALRIGANEILPPPHFFSTFFVGFGINLI
jgi:hypothetical protein